MSNPELLLTPQEAEDALYYCWPAIDSIADIRYRMEQTWKEKGEFMRENNKTGDVSMSEFLSTSFNQLCMLSMMEDHPVIIIETTQTHKELKCATNYTRYAQSPVGPPSNPWLIHDTIVHKIPIHDKIVSIPLTEQSGLRGYFKVAGTGIEGVRLGNSVNIPFFRVNEDAVEQSWVLPVLNSTNPHYPNNIEIFPTGNKDDMEFSVSWIDVKCGSEIGRAIMRGQWNATYGPYRCIDGTIIINLPTSTKDATTKRFIYKAMHDCKYLDSLIK